MTATALAAVGSNANENGTLLISGTAVTASGTSVDFTGIPSWAKRITVMFRGVSTNGASNFIIQIGAGSVTTTGYLSGAQTLAGTTTSAAVQATTGIIIPNGSSPNLVSGFLTLCLLSSNAWVSNGIFVLDNATNYNFWGAGSVALSGTLDRVRITTVNGTDTFDAGTINLLWE